MEPFDRSHTSSYSPLIVNVSIFCRYLDIQRQILAWPSNLR